MSEKVQKAAFIIDHGADYSVWNLATGEFITASPDAGEGFHENIFIANKVLNFEQFKQQRPGFAIRILSPLESKLRGFIK